VQTVIRANGQRITVVEPRPGARGQLARSILHMAMAYNLSLPVDERAQYLKWHRTYPVAAEEERRNDAIEQLQGTRNPLIDSPDNADVLVRTCSSR
jgi:deoxyribonuclease I